MTTGRSTPWIWIVFLAGIPLAPFLLMTILNLPIDVWQAQQLWAQGLLALVIAWSLTHATHPIIPNAPMAWWVILIGFLYLFFVVTTLRQQFLPMTPGIVPLVHLLCFVLMYATATTTWTIESLSALSQSVAWTATGLSIFAISQAWGGDQMFTSTIGSGPHSDHFLRNHRVIATLGNPTHLAAYLSCAIPLVAAQTGWKWRAALGITTLCLLLTDSFGGILAAVVAGSWLLAGWRPRWVLPALCFASGLGLLMSWTRPDFFSLSGRMERWVMLYEGVKQYPWTGLGLGANFAMAEAITNPQHLLYHWHHAHNEWLQLTMEQGVISLGLVLWSVFETTRLAWTLRYHALGRALGATWLAFLMNCTYNYSAHRWETAVLGFLAYCGVRVIHEELQLERRTNVNLATG